jgi:hypothetical protein
MSAASARTRFGIWKATVKALIGPSTPKARRTTISRKSPRMRERPVAPAKIAVDQASRLGAARSPRAALSASRGTCC